MPTFQHNIQDYLLAAQKESLITDFTISFNEGHVSCHKAIISQASNHLHSLILNNQHEYHIDKSEEASFEDLVAVIQALYGRSLPLTNKTVLSILFLSKSLSFSELSQCSHNVVTSWQQTTYINPVATILNNLRCDEFKDHEIIFHDFSLKIHKFFFASISPYFKAKFTKQWLDSNDTTSDFSMLLQVSPSSFSNFFTSFYDGKLEVNFENAFDYCHLAWYFQLSKLEKFVEDFIVNSKAEYQWVTSLVLKAINCEDYRFIKIISTKIAEIPDLSSCDPIPVHPLFFQNLTSNIDVSWLLKCLVFSYSNYAEDNVWTPQSLEKSIETIKFDTLPVDEIYQIIEPLFSKSDLFDVLSSFSLSIFSKFTSQVPLNWFTWFIVESDLRKEFNLISQVSPLLNEIITPENIDQVSVAPFISETLLLFAINFKQGTSIYWSLLCLIELWSRSQLNLEEFSRILMGFDLSETSFELVHSVLGKLFSDEILRPILFEFVSVKLLPRLVDENSEQASVISKLEADNNSKDNKITLQHRQIDELQREISQKDMLLNLPLVQKAINKIQELAKQQALDTEVNQEFISKGGLQFLASSKGSSITISDNDLVATKTGRGGSWANSFVAIQHPVKGKLVLTLLKFDLYFCTLLGFFDPSYLQIDYCFQTSHSLVVNSDGTQFWVNHQQSGPSEGPISRKQQIIIEFNNNQATFSVPSLGYSHIVTWPTGYVFGLTLYDQNTSWKLSRS
ncbi:hypothetical protein RCL1_008119 [Eukaryota sp. TZLM3-RCL]